MSAQPAEFGPVIRRKINKLLEPLPHAVEMEKTTILAISRLSIHHVAVSFIEIMSKVGT